MTARAGALGTARRALPAQAPQCLLSAEHWARGGCVSGLSGTVPFLNGRIIFKDSVLLIGPRVPIFHSEYVVVKQSLLESRGSGSVLGAHATRPCLEGEGECWDHPWLTSATRGG